MIRTITVRRGIQGRWGIVRRQPIYEKDRLLAPLEPGMVERALCRLHAELGHDGELGIIAQRNLWRHPRGVDACALDRRLDGDGSKIVGTHAGERAAIATDGRTNSREHDCASHARHAS